MPHAHAFPRRCRLRSAAEISQVFDLVEARASSSHFNVWVKGNKLLFPRIVIMVPKRTAKVAPRRNYMRRVTREYLRQTRPSLGPVDIVMKIKTSFNSADYAAIMQELGGIFTKLQKCRAS